MAFSSGSITFKRFFVLGDHPRQVDDALLEALAARSMTSDPRQTADYTEIGWTTGEHVLDTQFDFGKNVVADGLHFALRIDTTKPPTELIRSYQRMNEQTMMQATGREMLSKAQRREAREQALNRADKEARGGAYRRMKQVHAFWDIPRNEVYLASTGTTVVDNFMLLFRETFDRSLVPAASGELAARWTAQTGEGRAFEDCKPAHFISPPEGADSAGDMLGNLDEARSRDFLGTEWLTWLWFTSHVESPEIATPKGDRIGVLFEKSLALQCAFKLTGTTTMTADSPTRMPEATVALSSGKRPVRAAMQIENHGDGFSLAVRGDVMHYSSVVVPPPEEVVSPRALFEDRMARLRDLIESMDGLYAAFLKRRLSGKWPHTLSAMRSWIASGRTTHAETPDDSPALIPAVS